MPNVSKDMQLHQKPPTGLCGKLCSEASASSDKTEGRIRVCLEMGWQPFSFEVVYTQNKDVCVYVCGSPGVLYHLFLRRSMKKKRRRIK